MKTSTEGSPHLTRTFNCTRLGVVDTNSKLVQNDQRLLVNLFAVGMCKQQNTTPSRM